MRDQTVIKMQVQVLACSACGAEVNASCNCGKSYVPAKQRARDAIKSDPNKSDRAHAVELGLSNSTVSEARRELGVRDRTPEREGRDGKVYRLPARKPTEEEMPSEAESDASFQEALFDQACLLLEQMAGETRQRFFAIMRGKYNGDYL